MKKIIRRTIGKLSHLIFSATLIFGALFLTACSGADKNGIDNTCIVGSYAACIYEDTLFYFDRNTRSIKYQKLNDIQENGLPIFSDPLTDEKENPFSGITSFGNFFLVDPEATKNNRNNPVLIIAYQYWDWENDGRSYYKLVSFETNTNKITTIQDKLESIQSLHLYGNYIFYTTNEGDEGYNVHRIGKNGKNYLKMDNPNKDLFRVQTIYKDRVYFADAAGQLFSSTLSFEEKEYIFDIVPYIPAFIIDDYFVYQNNYRQTDFNNTPMASVDICRCPMSDVSKVETIISNIHVGMESGRNFYYYLSNPRIIGNSYLDAGTDKLYMYSFDDDKSHIIYDMSDQEVVRYYIALSDKYIVFEDTDYSIYDEDIRHMVLYNAETAEETPIPY